MGHVLAGCLTGFSCFLGQGKAKTKTKVWSSWIVARFLLSHACCVRLHMCKIRTLVRSLFRRARCNAIASSILLFAMKPVVIVVLSVKAHTLVMLC